MLLKIVQAGDKYLTGVAKSVSPSRLKSQKTQQFIDLMIETLRDKPGVGLAAPQVGESLQIIVVEDKKKYLEKVPVELLAAQGRRPVELKVIVNPKLEILESDEQYFFEGCLSVEGYRAIVPRAKRVIVTGFDRDGQTISIKADGWLARILQHEIDHLRGQLYLTKMLPASFIAEKSFAKDWAEATPEKLQKYVTRLGVQPR